MPDKGHNEEMTNLISKYLSGNANPEEIRELETWVLADPDNKKQFITFKKAWMLSGMLQADTTIHVDKIWADTSDQLFGNESHNEARVVSMQRSWLRYAAGFALLIVAAFLIYQFLGGNGELIVDTTDTPKNFELPDGSSVTLNQSSSLRYFQDEKTNERINFLSGDAFFEVTRDETSPFIIKTQGIEIQVLGTSFYVDSRADQSEVQVIVKSGSVAVRAESGQMVLAANEKGVFQKTSGDLVKQQNEDLNYLSLKTNILNFENSSLEEVVFGLNRHFNSDISIRIDDPTNCKITATFENKSMSTIIAVIEQTLGIKALEEGDKVVLSGAKCN